MDEIGFRIYKRRLDRKYIFKPVKKRLPKWYEKYRWEIYKKLRFERSMWRRVCRKDGKLYCKWW